MEKRKHSDKTAWVLSFFSGVIAIGFAIKSFTQPVLIYPALAATMFSAVIRAWRKGIVNEGLSILRLVGAFSMGWFFSEEAGKFIGLPGILGSIAGFYALFFTSFFIFGRLIWLLTDENNEPDMVSKLLGAFVGGFEGLILCWVVFFSVYSIPGSKLAEFYPDMFQKFTTPVENILRPVLPESAGNAVQTIKTAQKLAQGFDAAKVDREAVVEIMSPLTEMPEIQALQNDPEIQQIAAEKDFQKLLQNKNFRNLMESKELQERMMNLDWKKLEKAISPQP